MTNKTWNVEVAGQQHVIEVKSGSFAGGGSVTVDGKVVAGNVLPILPKGSVANVIVELG